MNEDLHPRRPQGFFLRPGPPGQINAPRAFSLERGGSGFGLAAIGLVGPAQAGERGAGCLKRRGDRGGAVPAADRFDAAGLEKVLGEVGAGVEVGGLAERGEEHFRPRAGLR